MNWLPTPPTDNLYKFAAISGIWLITIVIAIWVYLFNLLYISGIEAKQTTAYYVSLDMERQINNRLLAIKQKKLDEYRPSWIQKELPIAQEKILLDIALENHSKTVEKYKDVAEKEHNNPLIDGPQPSWFVYAFSTVNALAIVVTLWGFINWYKKLQRPQEKMHDIDYLIKQKTLQNLNIEMRRMPNLRAKK